MKLHERRALRDIEDRVLQLYNLMKQAAMLASDLDYDMGTLRDDVMRDLDEDEDDEHQSDAAEALEELACALGDAEYEIEKASDQVHNAKSQMDTFRLNGYEDAL